jgi:serine/threonine-protein kinase
MVSYEGNVKLVDFGVAKASNRAVETVSGMVKGKISYLSPEQCRCSPVDRRSDLFSLGIVAWEMLTGERLYQRPSDFETMLAIVEDPPPAPSALRAEVPPAIDALVLRLLTKSVVDRFQTAAEVVEAIENAAFGTGTMLSSVAVSRMTQDLLGPRAEPWRNLDREPRHGDTVTLIWQPIENPIRDSVDSADPPAPAGMGPATASMEVSASVAGLLAPASAARARGSESPPSGIASDERGSVRAMTSPEPPTTRARGITARAMLVGAALVAIAVAIWWIAPRLRAERSAAPASAIAGAAPAGAQLAPSRAPTGRPLEDPDDERAAGAAVPRSAAVQSAVAPAEPTAESPDRATPVADSIRRAPSAKHPTAGNAVSRATGPNGPARSGHGKPSVESVRRTFDAGDYAGVVAACRATTVTAAIAELCTRAACEHHDTANAQRWLPFNPPRLVDRLVAYCRALDDQVLRTPTLDCSNDPLDCR